MTEQFPQQPEDISTKGQHAGKLEGPLHEAGVVNFSLPLSKAVDEGRLLDRESLQPVEGDPAPFTAEELAEARRIVAEKHAPQKETKFGLGAKIGAAAAALAVAAGLWGINANANKDNAGTSPAPQPTAAGPVTPGVATPIETVPGQTPAKSKEFQSPELEARYNSIVDAVRVPVGEYPDAESAYAQFSNNLENWVSLKPSNEDIAQFQDYKSDSQSEFNGSAGVVIDIDREAYIETMFVNGNGGAFAKEINGYNQMLIGNYDMTFHEESPYQLTYTLVDVPSISAPASSNQLSPVIATYHKLDNAGSNSIGEARIASGNEPTIDEKHGVYMELVVVGEGEDAEWKIQKAQIVNRK